MPTTVVAHGQQRPASAVALRRDQDLLRRWRDGEDSAGTELLGLYKDFVHATCQRLGVRQADEVLEVWQDLVLRLLEKRQQLAERVTSSFAGYLAWQVRDLVQRRLEHAQRTQAAPLGDIAGPTGRDEPETAHAIRDCMERLPPREREVFELRYLHELSLKEVAGSLESNVNAVAQSVFRLVRRMRACLAAKGFEPEWSR